MSDERKEILTLEENLPDGTPCSYENEDKICIQVSTRVGLAGGFLFGEGNLYSWSLTVNVSQRLINHNHCMCIRNK